MLLRVRDLIDVSALTSSLHQGLARVTTGCALCVLLKLTLLMELTIRYDKCWRGAGGR